jgi:hypothetical protein
LKGVLFKTKDVLDFKIYTQKTYLVSKGFRTQSFVKINSCIGVKMAFKEKEILKSFAPFKTFGLFPMLEKPHPDFKMLVKK